MAQALKNGKGVVLVVMCSDERSLPYDVETAPMIKVPGGVLNPLCPCDSGATAAMKEAILIEHIKLLERAKRPQSPQIVTHADCAAQALIGLPDEQVKPYVEQFVARLHAAGVSLPVVVFHDDHCKQGQSRRHLLQMRCEPVAVATAA